MADDSRNSVMTVKSTKQLIRYLALAGYDSLMLYTEDTFDLPGYPYFGHMRGRYTEAELKEIDDYADLFGIEVIPCIQTLAHLSTALRWPDFDGFKDTEHILMVGDERTYAYAIAIRAVTTDDFMTADVAPLPYDLLGRISTRIIGEVNGCNHVLYDITTKPPASIEWE